MFFSSMYIIQTVMFEMLYWDCVVKTYDSLESYGIVTEIRTWRDCEIFIFVFLPFGISCILSFVSISSVLFIYGFNDGMYAH